MTMNDLLNVERAVNAELRARIAELEPMIMGRPEFDLSTVHGREQAVCKRLKLMGLKDDKMSARGMIVQLLVSGLCEAVRKDEESEGIDISAGLLGTH